MDQSAVQVQPLELVHAHDIHALQPRRRRVFVLLVVLVTSLIFVNDAPLSLLCWTRRQTYNDIPCVVDEGAETFLVENGVDPALAYHVAHLFAR